MNKKNKLPIKWMFGIIIILIAIACWTTQQAQNKNQAMGSATSNFFSQNNFLQFLGHLIGLQNLGNSSGGPFNANTSSTQGSNASPQGGNEWNNAGNTLGGNNSSGAGKNAGGTGANTEGITGTNAGQETGNIEGYNAEQVTGNFLENTVSNETGNIESNPSEINAENNPTSNTETSTNQETENPSEMNAENNPGANAETSQGNSFGGNLGNNSGNNSGNPSEGNSGNSLGSLNAPNLPTINPILPNDVVSQNIAQQNQQTAALAAILKTRQALVAPVIQQAQASKYQTVTAQDIPAPSINPPSSDIVAKVKANQLSLH